MSRDSLEALGRGDAPTLETIVQMTVDSLERSGLDEETYALVRIAALIAMDAAPVSYLVNIGAADNMGVPLEKIQGTLVAVAPVVGTARTVSAASKIVRALALAEEIVEDADDLE
jgi:4-carboxymuconolactone decarboxylase